MEESALEGSVPTEITVTGLSRSYKRFDALSDLNLSDNNAMAVTCTSEADYSLCMTRARAHTADDITSTIGEILALTGPIGGGGLVFTEESAAPDRLPQLPSSSRIVIFSLSSGVDGDVHKVDRDELIVSLTNALFRSQCVHSSGGNRLGTVADVLQEWLYDELSVPLDGSVSYDQVPLTDESVNWHPVQSFRSSWASETEAQHKAWFTEHGAAALACDAPAEGA